MKKTVSLLLILSIVISMFVGLNFNISAQTSDVSLEDMPIVDNGSYQGNMGDSCIFNLNRNGLPGLDGKYYRNGNVGVDGSVYENGFEVWLARWNFKNESSWAYATFELQGKYKTLKGKTSLIKSYNTSDFDTSVSFYDGEKLLASYRLTPEDYEKNMDIDVSGVNEIKVYIKDNKGVSGGTSFALYDMFLDGEISYEVTPFSLYFANYLDEYWYDMSNVAMPCEAIIANGGMPSLVWNTVLESVESLLNFRVGIDEKGYYQVILLDLLSNLVTSVEYEKEVVASTIEVANMLSDYLIDKGVDVSKEKLDQADLNNMWERLQGYELASGLQITKESYDALLKSGENTKDCLDKLSTYAVARQEGQQLLSAIALMAQNSDYEPLTDCLNEIYYLMNTEVEEMCKYISVKEVGKKSYQVVGDYLLGVIKKVPFLKNLGLIKDIVNISDWGSNLIFPTSTSSEQMYRIYTLYYIEDVIRSTFKKSYIAYQNLNSVENAENVLSCYEMFVRVYEHEISECKAMANLIYNKGFLNGIKNFFSTKNRDEYQSVIDWIEFYNVNLDTIKGYKQNAYIKRGVNLGLLQPVRFVAVTNNKIAGVYTQFVDTGTEVKIPDYDLSKKFFINPTLNKISSFDGWYYDQECTKPCSASSIKAEKELVLYSKFTTHNAKEIQVKCPVNVKIYDNSGALLLNIENDIVVENPGNLYVEILQKNKKIVLPSDIDYEISITATNDGVMNYSVTELEEGVTVRKVNFYDIPLYDKQNFEGLIDNEINLPENSYQLTTELSDGTKGEIFPTEDLSELELQDVLITTKAEGNGSVSYGYKVSKGDYFVATATPNEGEEFLGWYSNENLLSLELDYGFVAKEDIKLEAIFTQNIKNQILKSSVSSTMIINEELSLICGLPDLISIDDFETEYITISDNVTLEYNSDQIGSGTIVNLIDKVTGEVLEEYTFVIFGDYNGDGVADSEDTAYFASIANFEIFDYYDNEYLFMAADVNGDGSVDSMDEEDMNAVANFEAYIDHTITEGSRVVRY